MVLLAIALAVLLAASTSAGLVIPTDAAHASAANPPVRHSSGNQAQRTWTSRAGASSPSAVVPPLAAADGAISGTASWYRASGLIAAAGPELRRWLGKGWRGSVVQVCAGSCVTVTVSDWCQCYRGERRERVIDLSDDAFSRLAPLPTGLVRVTVRRGGGEPAATPPATDTE